MVAGERLQQIDGHLETGVEIGAAVGERGLGDGTAQDGEVLGGLGDDRLDVVGDEIEGAGGAGGEVREEVVGHALGLVEAGPRAVALAHAGGVVEDDDGGRGESAQLRSGIGHEGETGEDDDEQEDEQGAENEEDDILKLHAAAVLLDAVEEEARGGPLHALEARLAQQVDRNRQAHRE